MSFATLGRYNITSDPFFFDKDMVAKLPAKKRKIGLLDFYSKDAGPLFLSDDQLAQPTIISRFGETIELFRRHEQSVAAGYLRAQNIVGESLDLTTRYNDYDVFDCFYSRSNHLYFFIDHKNKIADITDNFPYPHGYYAREAYIGSFEQNPYSFGMRCNTNR